MAGRELDLPVEGPGVGEAAVQLGALLGHDRRRSARHRAVR